MASLDPFGNRTPLEAGFKMPAEWSAHARCWMAWPCRKELWGESLSDTQAAYADRSVVQVDIRKIAIGGGGIHCITQQQPT